MRFQILFGVAIIFIIARLVRQVYQGRIGYKRGVIYAVFWLTAFWAVLFPETTNVIARYFQITRGADFFMYTAIPVIFFILFKLFERIENISRAITEITRALALLTKQAEETNERERRRQ